MKKKTSIRAIDQGTIYDIPGKLIQLAREIERGDYGAISDVLVVVKKPEAGTSVDIRGFGIGEVTTQYTMASLAAARILGNIQVHEKRRE